MKKSKCLRIILSCMCVLPFTTQAAWHECCCPNFDYSYNPPLLEPTPCGHGYIEGEWLLFRSNMECATWGWVTAVNQDTSSGPSENILSVRGLEINQRQLSHDWNSGFRVAAAYDFDCDKWGVRATYTYFRSTADDHVHLINDPAVLNRQKQGVISNFVNFYAPDALQLLQPRALRGPALDVLADAHWRVEINQIDLDVTREYLIGRYVSLRPILGVRYYNFDTKITTRQADTDLLDAALSPILTEINVVGTRNKCQYHAFGIKSGIASNWEIGCGFGIYGDASLTIAYGQMRTKNHVETQGEIDPSASPIAFNDVFAVSDSTWCTVKPVADYAIGLYYRQGFNCDRSLFEVKVGWENHIYYGHNQFRGIALAPTSLDLASGTGTLTGTTDDRCADISFTGLAVSAGLWF